VELLVIGVAVAALIAVLGLAAALISFVVWLVLLPLQIIGFVFKFLGFVLAVPIMMAATGYDLLKMREALSGAEAAQLALSLILAFVVALLTIRAFIRALNRWSLVPFAWYRIVVAPIFYLITRGS